MPPCLYPYQERSVAFALNNPYCILALEVGLGKTLVALTVGVKTNSKMLIVCPSYLKNTWQQEILKFYPNLKSKVLETKKDIQSIDRSNIDEQSILIVSYHLSNECEALFEWADLVICDEAHNLKAMNAKRTLAVHKNIYENSIKRVLLLTGTPIMNRVYEFYSLIALCNYNPKNASNAFLMQYPSYIEFADTFSYRREYEIYRNGRSIKVLNWEGFKNGEDLKTWLRGIYIKFKAQDVLKDLPEKVYKEVLISASHNKALLDEYEKVQGLDGMDTIKPQIKALNALSKVEFTIEYVKDLLLSTDKVLVYTDHVDSAHALARGLGVKAITGSMPMKERQEITNSFQNGGNPTIVATIGSLSTGITLTACCNLVLNDLPWVPASIAQLEGRIQRIGQKRKCVVHKVFGSHTDKYISDKITEKSKIITECT